MEEIILETAESLPEAVAFANRQFGVDFLQFQSKLYGCPEAGETYTFRKNKQIAGMLSVYPIAYQDLRCLSVGTVCTSPEFRGQGVMTALFETLERDVFPNYDIITLCGKRTRYERFGFAKAMTVPEYWFYPEKDAILQIVPATEKDGTLLHDLWLRHGNGVHRRGETIINTLTSAGHEVYLLTDGAQWGYISWRQQKRIITEYCGLWPIRQVVDTLANAFVTGKVGIVGRYNHHNLQLLNACDSYLIRNYGNIRIPNMDVAEIYELFGYGGEETKQILPSSLFFLDGI